MNKHYPSAQYEFRCDHAFTLEEMAEAIAFVEKEAYSTIDMKVWGDGEDVFSQKILEYGLDTRFDCGTAQCFSGSTALYFGMNDWYQGSIKIAGSDGFREEMYVLFASTWLKRKEALKRFWEIIEKYRERDQEHEND